MATLIALGEDPGGLRTRLVSQRETILGVAAKRGASNIRVFGSIARGDHHPGSDVDLLVDLRPGSACSMSPPSAGSCPLSSA